METRVMQSRFVWKDYEARVCCTYRLVTMMSLTSTRHHEDQSRRRVFSR